MAIAKTDSGRWRARVDLGTDPSGRRDQKQATFATKREAQRWEREMLARRDALHGRSGRMTLSAYVETRYRPLMDQLAASSRDTYERELRLRILPYLGPADVRDIDRPMVQRMVDGCATESVARKALGTLKTVLNECRSDGLIAVNPATLHYRMPPKGKARDNGLVLGTFQSMRPVFDALSAWGDDGTCAKLAVTGLLMGLRPEERYGLDWADFDWDARVVRIRRAYLQVSRAEGVHCLKAPKTENGARDVPVPTRAADLLRPLESDGPFMAGPGGGRLSPSTGRRRWNRFLRENPGVPPVTIENMRHSFATSFLASGGNVENLSRVLGHADINTTFKRYVRPTTGNLATDMGRVDTAFR